MPKNCVELIVYDNDGPEGYFHRQQFERSAEAIEYILKTYPKDTDRKNLNFEITNYWKNK